MISEIKIDKKSLLHDLQMMDFNYEDAQVELSELLSWLNSLPSTLELYRIVYVDNQNEINVKTPGDHYSVSKEDLLDSHTYTTGYGDLKYLITVSAKKSMIDAQQTLSNNILYPNEREITLKNKGKGSKVISITPITENIQEQNSSHNLSELLVKMVNEHGVYKAMEMTGLDVIQLFDRMGNNIVIDSEMANGLLRMLWNKNLLPKNVNNWKLSFDTFDGVLYWDLTTESEEAQAMCTPFWEGYNSVPIDFSYYTYIEDGIRYEYNPEWYESIDYKDNFNSIQDLIEWFKEWYIPVVYHQVNKFLKKSRKEYEGN
jgi:hypothetical protein